MATNQEIAEHYAQRAIDLQDESKIPSSVTGLSGIATAHAVLALLDYIKQDDTMPSFEETINNDIEKELQTQQEYIRHLGRHIVHLEEDLEGARAALRACDAALNTEMKAAADD